MKGEDIDHRLVVDATPALIFSARPDGYVDYFNRRWFLVLGARQDDLEDGNGRSSFTRMTSKGTCSAGAPP